MKREKNKEIFTLLEDLLALLDYLQEDSDHYVLFNNVELYADENYNLYMIKYNEETKRDERVYKTSFPLIILCKIITNLKASGEFEKVINNSKN